MTLHYHGCPITPRETLLTLAGRSFCNSFAEPRDTLTCHQIGQANMLDNGAFTIWRQGGIPDWSAWADWVQPWLDYPTTWAVLPDAIDAGQGENDRLLTEWAPVLGDRGAPVWHLDEPVVRLIELCSSYSRVCFGSAGAYAVVGSPSWQRRVAEAFDAITDQDGRVRVWVHMLRGMALSGSHFPFASVDSTDVGRNHNRVWNDAARMVARWDSLQCPARWERTGVQLPLEDSCVA